MRNLLHGFILSLLNIVSIIAAHVVYYYIFKPANQIAIQAPLAVIFTVISFNLWMYISKVKYLKIPVNFLDYLFVYLFAIIFAPLIFIPLHFITQGYITSLGNILSMCFFQSIANLIAISISSKFTVLKYKDI